MGEMRGDVYKIIPPPYTLLRPITSRYPPKGMVRTKGTPQQTLTFIGGKVPFENVSFDLGVTDGFIDVKSRTIEFTGRGLQTDVGTRILGPTRGVELKHNPPVYRPSKMEDKVKKPLILDVGAGDNPMHGATHAIDTGKPKLASRRRVKEYHIGDFQNPPNDWRGKFDKIVSNAALGTPSDEDIEYFKSPSKTGKALDFVTKPDATLEIQTGTEYLPNVQRILKYSHFYVKSIEPTRGPHGGILINSRGHPTDITIKAKKGSLPNIGTRIESTTKGVALTHNPPLISQRQYEISRPQRPSRGSILAGVGYTDKIGKRLSRRHHRGFRKVKFS
jgi:hypothetical protein